ncbi:ALF repeat-containing protein [Streptomyces sp. NPDC093071]|uniref:ALF repeat-containing protein n=1 Tax=Streptomyces sp. NPDC093071 TaxID=3366022 RepID=UPI0038064601
MRLHRVVPGIAVGVLVPALLLATPSVAATAAPTTVAVASSADLQDADDLRMAILRILADPDSGRRVTREANALLDANDPAAMRAWLETGYRIAQGEDDRVALMRLLADPDSGRRVIAEVNALLDTNDTDAMRAWLETGYRIAQAEDDRVTIMRILADPSISPALRTAANAALDDNTPEVLRHFLEIGRYQVD